MLKTTNFLDEGERSTKFWGATLYEGGPWSHSERRTQGLTTPADALTVWLPRVHMKSHAAGCGVRGAGARVGGACSGVGLLLLALVLSGQTRRKASGRHRGTDVAIEKGTPGDELHVASRRRGPMEFVLEQGPDQETAAGPGARELTKEATGGTAGRQETSWTDSPWSTEWIVEACSGKLTREDWKAVISGTRRWAPSRATLR